MDLIGVLAYGELVSFERNAADAAAAPSLSDKVHLAHMAQDELRHFETLCTFLRDHNVDPQVAMEPFVAAVDAFHTNLLPRDWVEGIAKTYVGDGIAADFYREVSGLIEQDAADVVRSVVSDTPGADYIVTRLRDHIASDPRVGGRLALWGRRMMGEMISQATVVANSRPALRDMFLSSAATSDITGLTNRLTLAHARRMDELGLAS